MTIYKYEDMKTVQTCTEASETQGTVQKITSLFLRSSPPFVILCQLLAYPLYSPPVCHNYERANAATTLHCTGAYFLVRG